MPLLELPPELLDLIIVCTQPSGLESFVLTCKAIYVRAGSQIDRHNALKRRWKHTTNAVSERRGDTLKIIYEISCDPIAAEYIEYLSLWDRRLDDEVDHSFQGYDFRQDKDAMQSIKDLLFYTKFFANADREEWWDQMLKEDSAHDEEGVDKLYASVALLSLLPNLKTLQLPDRWHEIRLGEAAEALVPSVESLVAMTNSRKRLSVPLQSLETILPFVEEGYDVRVGLQCLQPLMALRSVRNLYAVSCVAVEDDWGGMPFHWPNYSPRSPLTKLELAYCCMDARGLSALLVNTPELTTFRYSHQTKWDGLEYDWNAGEFVDVLANYCGDRITDLALTIDELHGEIINGLSSFMRFTKLQVLEVDVRPFCGPPLESGQQLGRNASMPTGASPWTHADIPCLGDMLPQSIKELHVNTDFPEPSEQALIALFKNIKARRQTKLTQLKKQIIRQYRSCTARGIADDHNITLEVFDADTEDPRPRSMMPQWKRQFDRYVGGIVMTGNH